MEKVEKRKNSKGMILAIDMGNTNIVIGCIDEKKVLFEERLSTDLLKTELEYAIGFKTVLELNDIDSKDIKGAIISSVVPQLLNVIKKAVEKTIGISPLVVGPGIKSGINLLMDQPKQIGGDLIVGAVAVIKNYGAPAIVVDMGTATTIVAIDENSNYIGGAILPGLSTSMNSLVSKTAQLPRVSMEAPKNVIGKNTIDSMNSGLVYGNASCIDGMIDRFAKEMHKDISELKIVATGGLSKVVIPHCNHKIILDNELLLKGLRIIYDKNIE